jgi:hypothetical protein
MPDLWNRLRIRLGIDATDGPAAGGGYRAQWGGDAFSNLSGFVFPEIGELKQANWEWHTLLECGPEHALCA